MSRTGELWRGDFAQRIEDHLAGLLPADELMDWALDHPFFEDRSPLDAREQSLIGHALGRVLQLSATEPPETRTTEAQLEEVVGMLWHRSAPQPER